MLRSLQLLLLLFVMIVPLARSEAQGPADRVHVMDGSDPRAIEIAQGVVEAMGGWDAWDTTRFVRWNFFGSRLHYWDKWTGNARIEADSTVFLMNVNTKTGHVWEGGVEVLEPDRLAELLLRGHKIWINDSYWMFFPFKMLDSGVTLTYAGEDTLEGGRVADVLTLVFDDAAGYTPKNKYDAYVARDTGLMEQWAFYTDAADPEPRFTLPWAEWKRFGEILIATSHGQGKDWDIAVLEDVPIEVFTKP